MQHDRPRVPGRCPRGTGQNGGVGPGNTPIFFAIGGDDGTHTRAGGRGSNNMMSTGARGQDAPDTSHASGGGGGGGAGFVFAFTTSTIPISTFIVPPIRP